MKSCKEIKIGNKVTINDTTWIILTHKDGECLLLSKEILFRSPFDDESNNYENSSLSKILRYYHQNLFTEDEICNYGFEDRHLFLLSVEEYQKYRELIPKVDYWWWLRSPGDASSTAASVYIFGCLDMDGDSVRNAGGVRPAIYVNDGFVYDNLKDCGKCKDCKPDKSVDLRRVHCSIIGDDVRKYACKHFLDLEKNKGKGACIYYFPEKINTCARWES